MAKDDLKNVERETTIQQLKNLELRKDADRIMKQNEQDSPWEVGQEEINTCIMKEDSHQLSESLVFMYQKM